MVLRPGLQGARSGARCLGPAPPPRPPPAWPLPAGRGQVHACSEVPVEAARGSDQRCSPGHWGTAQPAGPKRDDSTPGPRPTRPRPFSGLPAAPPERKVGAGRRQGQSPRACPGRAEQDLRPASEIVRSSPARLYRPCVDT